MLANESYGILSSKELDERLERWADWARGPPVGSIRSAEGVMREYVDAAADSAEMTVDISITERALARTKMEDKAYWRVISRYYLGRQPLIFIAGYFHVSEHNIKRLFDEAKGRIGWHIFEIENEG